MSGASVVSDVIAAFYVRVATCVSIVRSKLGWQVPSPLKERPDGSMHGRDKYERT